MKRQGKLIGLLFALGLANLVHAEEVTYVYTDVQGTPVMESDAQGNITARYDYRPYGTPVASMNTPTDGPGYTGHVSDADTGLVYMQARYYDPSIGRFISKDGVSPTGGETSSFNIYWYSNGNPLKFFDPDGKSPMTEREATQLAQNLNTRSSDSGSTGFYTVVKTGPGDNDYTVQSSEQAAMERGGFAQQAEQSFQPGQACPAQCAAISVAAAVVAGDISDSPSAGPGNNVRDAVDTAQKAAQLLEKAPSNSVMEFAKGAKISIPIVKAAIAVPATVNNYKQCIKDCENSYINRPSTEKKRDQ